MTPAAVLVRDGVAHQPRWQPGERLQHLFEARCDRLRAEGAAAQLAVDGDAPPLRYDELDQLANRLARHLRALGHGPGDVIGLLLDKTAWSYAAMLAVLKIHAAYVPLDAGFPADRIGYIVADAGVRRLITTSAQRPLLAEAGAPLCCVDELETALQALPGHRLDAAETGPPAGELCYVIYTSGSTGRPKGVPIDHGQIVNFVRVACETYGYRADDRVYQGLTLAFDFAVEEIWVPLATGATLLPNQSGGSLLGAELADFLRRHRATALCCVPTLLATLDEELPLVRLLIVSGEACPRDLVTRWHRPGRELLNAYGPTEATVTATLGRPLPGQPVTIGQPLPTYAIVVLAPGEARALPFGETGEIGIAGIGIARGYLNREAQTRAAFIDDFIGVPHNTSGRIYRTGDLGRINAAGDVEYLGRIDTQVKIRGYRIELGEIESLLLQVPHLAQAVVGTHESSPGVTELVAYYTQQPGTPVLAADALATHLRTLLPGYMVPAFYERLDAMPMLASDKADRRALPPPAGARLQPAARPHVAAEGALETAIADDLAALLQLERVSADDHFFDDLGANSLLMARFGAGLRRRLQRDAPSMRDLYAAPTVRRLAHLLSNAGTVRAPLRPERAPHVASRAAYVGCAVAQALLAFAFVWAHASAWWTGWHWAIEADGWAATYARSAVFAVGYFAAASGAPIALKWLLVGRWKPTEFPVWGLRYLRFWAVRELVRRNPMAVFAGTPLYVVYLRLLGARVAWSARVWARVPPACTDLLDIGPGAVVGYHVLMSGYRAEGGRICIGPIRIGARCHVGEGALVDIDTVMADDSSLAHASGLHAGQRLEAGRDYHGSPAQPTDAAVAPLARDDADAERHGRAPSPLRCALFSLFDLAAVCGAALPLPLLLSGFAPDEDRTAALPLAALLALGWASYLGGLLARLLAVGTLPRLLAATLTPGRTYPLFGPHFVALRWMRGLGNVKFFNTVFGDSSAIVHYLRLVGYRFPGLRQTGSNFGLSQQHDDPTLCEFGSGTMVSDGLTMLNADHGRHVFRLDRLRVGADNFVGNNVFFPRRARVGDNCLLATKVMLPIDGALRRDVGLLGSPCFEIPRSVRRDQVFRHAATPQALAARLRLKNRSNALTAGAYVLSGGVQLSLLVLLWWLAYPWFQHHGGLFLACFVFAGLPLTLLYLAAVDAASRGFARLQPQFCSIYDDYFWRHERHWKLGLSNDHALFGTLAGTPFKSLLWRLLGVRVGRQLFDDGCAVPEKTLVRIGDHCTLGAQSTLQSHSLEDGTFKSDHIVLGDGCSIGANAFVHYGTRIGDRACVAPDAFVMKGEQLDAAAVWRGNPAQAQLVE